MQAKTTGKRDRISVSLDAEEYEWIQSLARPGDSMSFTLAQVVKEARLSGVVPYYGSEPAGGIIQELVDWLSNKKNHKLASELRSLLEEFLAHR
jgi:hypothetical protein